MFTRLPEIICSCSNKSPIRWKKIGLVGILITICIHCILFFFCLTGDISGRIYVMDDNNICCTMNADFVLTNYSTNTNQESSSVIKLLIDLTTGMEILVHFSSLFIILNSMRNISWVCWKGSASYYFVTQTRISQKHLQYYYDKELIHFTKKFDVVFYYFWFNSDADSK